MWSMACDDRNCEKGSDEKGGPIFRKEMLGCTILQRKRPCKH